MIPREYDRNYCAKLMMARRVHSKLTIIIGICLLSSLSALPRLQSGPHLVTTKLHALILGVNKYSHDTSICITDGDSGEILFTLAKERLTGRKHDGGSVTPLLDYGLKSIGAKLSDIEIVVSNNHHYRVHPFERRIPFLQTIKYVPEDYSSDLNLLPQAKHFELSHHLAHAWSAIGTAPFSDGLIVVMDGMGESYKAMIEDMIGTEENSGDYMHDLRLLKAFGASGFVGKPTSLAPGSGYREAESAYVFDRSSCVLKPVFKRWSRERSPPELYNHGFENMESIGAVYSRISSQILGDWNACGKVMGLAAWADKKKSAARDWIFSKQNINGLSLGDDFYHKVNLMSDDSFQINWKEIESLQKPNQWSDENFGYYANLANSVQSDLESVAVELCSSLKATTGCGNLALVGGVALNSVMNGRIKKDCGFDNVYIPSAPGDEGIAIGCAIYGLQRKREQDNFEHIQNAKMQSAAAPVGAFPSDIFNFPRSKVDQLLSQSQALVDESLRQSEMEIAENATIEKASSNIIEIVPEVEQKIPFHQQRMSAYQGKQFTVEELDTALYEMDPWITFERFDSDEELIADAAEALNSGKVISWFQGRSEFGQRALGSRSILADPRRVELRRFINDKVKQREWFRPLAPSVLDDFSGDWFEDLTNHQNESPYMSLTATVRAEKQDIVPAICHVDGTARLQTVAQSDAPLYYALIQAFYKLSKVPMVLNTSFNRKSQPIVESPIEAIQTFLSCQGDIAHLYMGNVKITVKPFPLDGIVESEESGQDILVFGEKIYLSEVTNSNSAGVDEPVRVRIQDGGWGISNDDATQEWRELPSLLHLELLQLLQSSDDGGYEPQSGSVEDSSTITMSELLEAIKEIRSDEEESTLATNFSSSMRWLYSNGLVYFQSLGDDEDALQKLIENSEVLDLRSLS